MLLTLSLAQQNITHTHPHYERVACNVIIIIAIGMSLFIGKKASWPAHLQSALGGMDRITDRCFLWKCFYFLSTFLVFPRVHYLFSFFWQYWFAANCLSHHCFLLISEIMLEMFILEQNLCVMTIKKYESIDIMRRHAVQWRKWATEYTLNCSFADITILSGSWLGLDLT